MSKLKLLKIVLFFLTVFAFLRSVSFAEEKYLCHSDEKHHIQSIQVSGNTKTNVKVLTRELGFSENDLVCDTQILEGINRIKRTGLFSIVEHNLSKVHDTNSAHLKITVDERWTSIPILKVNSGGGVSQYTIGMYDPNLLGEFIEAGAQYENLEGASSGVIWFKNPRIAGKRQGIDLQYWNTKRIRIKYDQDKSSPSIKQGFLHEREKLYADYFKEVSADVTARIALDYNRDRFSTDLLPDSVLDKTGPNPALPPSTELLILKIGLEHGQVSGDSHALSGQVLSAYLSHASPLNGKVDSFFQGDVAFNFFRVFSPDWQFAQRLIVGATSTDILQYWYYLGGLDRIRGFSDNRFSGRYFGLSNSEVRYLLLEKPSLLVQGASFLDISAVGDELSKLSKIKAASVGMGIRFILPKFYRFVIRLDYAKPIIKNDTMNWSFGVQQFF